MTTTSDLLGNLAASRARLLASFAGPDDEQLARKGSAGRWSIKDTLGHVTAWERMVVGFLPQWLATGTTPEVLEVMEEHGEDAANAVEVAERAALNPREQIEELEQARARLVAYIQSLGDAALAHSRPLPYWEDSLARYFVDLVGAHELEHAEAIEAAAERLGGGEYLSVSETGRPPACLVSGARQARDHRCEHVDVLKEDLQTVRCLSEVPRHVPTIAMSGPDRF